MRPGPGCGRGTTADPPLSAAARPCPGSRIQQWTSACGKPGLMRAAAGDHPNGGSGMVAGMRERAPVPASTVVTPGCDRRTATGPRSARQRVGRKRHPLTDTDGLLLEVTVTTADVHDSKAAPRTAGDVHAAAGPTAATGGGRQCLPGSGAGEGFPPPWSADRGRAPLRWTPRICRTGPQMGRGAHAEPAGPPTPPQPRPRTPPRPPRPDGAVGRRDQTVPAPDPRRPGRLLRAQARTVRPVPASAPPRTPAAKQPPQRRTHPRPCPTATPAATHHAPRPNRSIPHGQPPHHQKARKPAYSPGSTRAPHGPPGPLDSLPRSRAGGGEASVAAPWREPRCSHMVRNAAGARAFSSGSAKTEIAPRAPRGAP